MSGGRLNLRLESSEGARARYRAELSLDEQSFRGTVDVSAEGVVSFELDAEAPAWLCQAASAILRAEWRSRAGQEAAQWPRRITRWRISRIVGV